MSKLNTLNPEQLVYDNGVLILSVLGGIKLEGLDRMRVTLKIEVPEEPRPPLRHNLDLYNDTGLEKLIRKAAERLEVGTSVLEASLSELTENLEQYRLQQIKASGQEKETKKQLTQQEREQAENFLKSPDLLNRTNELIGQSGVIGEELNRLLMYLIFTSRKRENPLHVISLGSSGTGKTHLQEKVGQLIPDEERIEITTLSENAFYYFGQRELKHRLILIEDLDGAENVLYPMRELMSKRRISKTVAHKTTKGETKTINLVVEGPVSVAGCTTKESIYEDNANRSFLLYLDESKEQDEKIMQYQRSLSAGQINTEAENQIKKQLQDVQRILEPVKVINPYAPLLKIPTEVFKPRRTNVHYLAFIEMITYYHQYQREQQINEATGEKQIETTIEDIRQANQLMKEILLRKSDELTGSCRNYFERLKQWLKIEAKTAFTNIQARVALRENHSNQKRYMTQLQEIGLVKKGRGDKKKGFYYEVLSTQEYEQLKTGITNILDEILESISTLPHTAIGVLPIVAVQSSQEVQEVNELLKPTPGVQSSKKFTETQKEKIPPYLIPLLNILQANPEQHYQTSELSKHLKKSRRAVAAQVLKLTKLGLIQCHNHNTYHTYVLSPQITAGVLPEQTIPSQVLPPQNSPLAFPADGMFYTLHIIKQHWGAGQSFTTNEIVEITKKNTRTEQNHIKKLTDKGLIIRHGRTNYYTYTLNLNPTISAK